MSNRKSDVLEKPVLSRAPAASSHASSAALLACLAAITMFFAALTSAHLIRRGLASDWQSLKLPGQYYSTALFPVLTSSLMELIRRGRFALRRMNIACLVVAALGVGLVCVQWSQWAQLRASGVSLASNPAAAFFCILGGAFGVLIAGGVLALARAMLLPGGSSRSYLGLVAIYWHYVGILWVYLLILFSYLD